jgi:rod shape-determining protein MreD
VSGRTSGYARLTAIVVSLTFLHFALRPVFGEWLVSPSLVMCGLLLSARHLRPGTAAVLGLCLGLLEDVMAVSHFGLAAAVLAPLAYMGSRTRDLFLGEEPLFMGAYLFLGTWIFEATTGAIVGGGDGILSEVFLRAPGSALATALVGYLIVPLLRSR